MLRLAFDFIITWRETRTRPNAYGSAYTTESDFIICLEMLPDFSTFCLVLQRYCFFFVTPTKFTSKNE